MIGAVGHGSGVLAALHDVAAATPFQGECAPEGRDGALKPVRHDGRPLTADRRSSAERAAPDRARRVVHDFTVGDDLMCPECGYVLRGLPATRRCPECGSLVVEAIRVAQHATAVRREREQSWRRDLSLFRGRSTKDDERGEWRAATWLAFIGVLGVLARVVLDPSGRSPRLVQNAVSGLGMNRAGGLLGSHGGLLALLVLAAMSAIACTAGLLFAERLGFAGFTSRRAVIVLVALLHVFALGVAMVVPQAGPVLIPLLATAPLAWLLASNAPNPTPVLQVVGVAQAFAVLAWLVATVL